MTHYFPVDTRALVRLHDDFSAGRISDESVVEAVRQIIEEHEIVIGDRVTFDRRTDPNGHWWKINGINNPMVWCSTVREASDQEFPISAIVAKAGKEPS